MHLFPGQGRVPIGIGAVRRIKGTSVKSQEEAGKHFKKMVKRGHEGQVIQKPSGERIRRKQLDDSEFAVDAIRSGRGGRKVASVSGQGTKSRVLLPPTSSAKKGDQVTVQHQGRTRSGKLRHPRFKAVRDYDLNAKLDRALQEFGIVGAGLAIAQHVGGNIVTRNAMRPGSKSNRAAAAIFRKGVNDRRSGKRIKGALVGASEMLIGPELSKTYEAGLKSTRTARYAASKFKPSDETQAALKSIMTSRGSKRVTKVLEKIPSSKTSGGYERGKKIGRGAAFAGTLALDPIGGAIPAALNASKTAMANSVERGGIGKRIVNKIAIKGFKDGKSKGPIRSIGDVLVSPTASIIRDVGASVSSTGRSLRGGLKRSMIGKMSRKDMKEAGRAIIDSGMYQPRKK